MYDGLPVRRCSPYGARRTRSPSYDVVVMPPVCDSQCTTVGWHAQRLCDGRGILRELASLAIDPTQFPNRHHAPVQRAAPTRPQSHALRRLRDVPPTKRTWMDESMFRGISINRPCRDSRGTAADVTSLFASSTTGWTSAFPRRFQA